MLNNPRPIWTWGETNASTERGTKGYHFSDASLGSKFPKGCHRHIRVRKFHMSTKGSNQCASFVKMRNVLCLLTLQHLSLYARHRERCWAWCDTCSMRGVHAHWSAIYHLVFGRNEISKHDVLLLADMNLTSDLCHQIVQPGAAVHTFRSMLQLGQEEEVKEQKKTGGSGYDFDQVKNGDLGLWNGADISSLQASCWYKRSFHDNAHSTTY